MKWLNWIVIGGVIAIGLGYLAIHIAVSPAFANDGRIYAAAARTWLSGGDPWSARVQDIQFAAPPPSLILATPLAWLPDDLAGPVSVVVAGVFAILAVRLARAQWWWLFSIPVVEGVFVGSFDLGAVALIIWALREEGLRGRIVGAIAAPLAKIYALVPAIALGRRSAVIAGLAALIVTAPLLPWAHYAERFPELMTVLAQQSGNGSGSPWSAPWLLPPTVIALALLGRRDGAWLLVPALWPASQAHYGVFMIPVGSPILALVVALPITAPGAVAVIALAILRAVRGELDPWSWLPGRWRPPDRASIASGRP
jgi:hypothetical protein